MQEVSDGGGHGLRTAAGEAGVDERDERVMDRQGEETVPGEAGGRAELLELGDFLRILAGTRGEEHDLHGSGKGSEWKDGGGHKG